MKDPKNTPKQKITVSGDWLDYGPAAMAGKDPTFDFKKHYDYILERITRGILDQPTVFPELVLKIILAHLDANWECTSRLPDGVLKQDLAYSNSLAGSYRNVKGMQIYEAPVLCFRLRAHARYKLQVGLKPGDKPFSYTIFFQEDGFGWPGHGESRYRCDTTDIPNVLDLVERIRIMGEAIKRDPDPSHWVRLADPQTDENGEDTHL
jgi:hypothetical protein